MGPTGFDRRRRWTLCAALAATAGLASCADLQATLSTGADASAEVDGDVAPTDGQPVLDLAADAAALTDADVADGDAPPPMDAERPEPPDQDQGPPADAAVDAQPPPDLAAADLGTPPVDPPDGPNLTCTYAGPADEREVNTWREDVERVRFVVPGLGDPSAVRAAFVRFRGWDLDTPGREGHLQVNDGPLLPLPADPANTNAHAQAVIQVDPAQLRAGDNLLKFIAFDQPEGAYFRISQVSIETQGPAACPAPVEPPPPDDGRTGLGREQTIGYRDATYTERRNWVLDCRDYAYSARGEEHTACDAQFRPDGSTHGTASFAFRNIVADLYEVRVEGRLTENRNPRGALVRVGNQSVRIDQRSGGEVAFQSAGRYLLSGEATVIIDSTQENGSDSVRRVQLRPVTD